MKKNDIGTRSGSGLNSVFQNPNTFNYAVNCVSFDLRETPRVWLVDYKFSKFEIQKRIPGGKFIGEDLLKAIDNMVQGFTSSGHRDHSLEYLYMEIDVLNRQYVSDSNGITDFATANPIFNEFTANLFKKVQDTFKNKSEDLFLRLIEETQINSVKRELKEEIDATRVGIVSLLSVSEVACHFKLNFVSMDIDAPSSFIGSPDPKIIRSYSEEISECTGASLYNGHSNNFEKGLRFVIESNPKKFNFLKKNIKASR